MSIANETHQKSGRRFHSWFVVRPTLILASAIILILPSVSLAIIIHHSIPDGFIEAIEVNESTAYRIRLPLGVVTPHLQNTRHFDAWIEFIAAATSGDVGDITMYACETPCAENPDQIRAEFFKVKLISNTEVDRVRIEILSIILGAINEGYESGV
jgi:hypothetical protein